GLHSIEVIVLLGRSSFLTLDALQWCQDQDIALLIIDRSGCLVSVVTPPAPPKISLRRAQYTADPLPLARDVLSRKIAAQTWARPEIARPGDSALREPDQAGTCDALRLIEGRLAQDYWTASAIELTWKGKGIPDAWRSWETRSSWNGTPRHARH